MKEILLKIEKNIALVIMNRPHVFNAINGDLVDELSEVLDTCAADPEVRCIILTGEGKAFCAGGDLSYLESLSEAETLEFFKKFGALAIKLHNIPKPTIAMINGVAAGAGFNIALACDMIYASDTARFAQSFAKVGLIPDFGGLYFLPQIVGPYRAKELMFTAELTDTHSASRMGLINKVCSKDALYDDTMIMAHKMAKSAPNAVATIKKYINQPGLTLEQVLDIELVEQPKCMASEEFKEGVAAFKEKRNPKFKKIKLHAFGEEEE